MNWKRVLGVIATAMGLSAVFAALFFSGQFWGEHAVEKTTIEIQYPDNQVVIAKEAIEPLIQTFFEDHPDSNMLKANTFLLETSLEELPYVDEAQVYWNLNTDLVVEVRAKQAVAKAFLGGKGHLITATREVLPTPRGVVLDLPVLSGVQDSAGAAAAAEVLHIVEQSTVFSREALAQLDTREDQIVLVPNAYDHKIIANADDRLAGDLEKLAAYYAATSDKDLENIGRIDLRFANQVVTGK